MRIGFEQASSFFPDCSFFHQGGKMKLKTLLGLASARFPDLAETLTLDQLVHFCTIGADFIRRTFALYPTSAISAPIEFLSASLPYQVSPSYWAQLWNITESFLFACHVNSDKAFRDHGIPVLDCPVNSFDIPELVLLPPVNHCLECDPAMSRRLTNRPPMQGYLYDLDGVRTVLHHSRYCRSQYICYSISVISALILILPF